MAREDKSREGLRKVSGIHSVQAAVQHGAAKVVDIYYDQKRRDNRMSQLLDMAHGQGIRLKAVAKAELDRMAPDINHQGIVAEVHLPESYNEEYLQALLKGMDHPPMLLILDGVQDPHNLGACLRSADAAGVDAVIIPRDNSAGLTPVVCKVASGAAEVIPLVQVTNLARTLRWLRDETNIWIVGTAGEAESSLFDASLTGPLAIVMGGEGKGMRRLTREHCDLLVKLPMGGSVASLNVSVATGICLFEAIRQRAAVDA